MGKKKNPRHTFYTFQLSNQQQMQRKVSVSLNDLTHEMIVKPKKLSVCGLPITTKQNNKAGTHTAKKGTFGCSLISQGVTTAAGSACFDLA